MAYSSMSTFATTNTKIHGTVSSTGAASGKIVEGHTLVLPSGDFGDDLRRMNAERVKLDEELRESESKDIKIFVDDYVSES